jgi:excinuclease ABC subunit C
MERLRQKVRRLPRQPGVYLLKDDSGKVIYVGKALDLRSRVSAYVTNGQGDGRALFPVLVSALADLDFVVTGTEKEALILENTLIKKHRPRFNVTYRDDKTYVSIRIALKEPFPRIHVTRFRNKDGAAYFGPYASKRALKETLRAVRTIFPLRHCTIATMRQRKRPCLYYEMGQCLAPCVGLVDEDGYADVVKGAVLYLRGKKQAVVRRLEKSMYEAAERREFEKAAVLRDRVTDIKRTLETQLMVDQRDEDRDIFGWLRSGSRLAIQVMTVRGGRLSGSANHLFENRDLPTGELTASFVNQYYAVEGREIPPEVVFAGRPAGWAVLEERISDLRGRRVRFTFPQRGSKARLARLARENARWALEADPSSADGPALVEQARNELGIDVPPQRIECFDISTTQGESATASMVTFVGGLPDRSGYRRFKVLWDGPPDDYAMMRQVLERRLRRAIEHQEGWELPDLILLDGGPGQLGVARSALDHLAVEGPVLASIAKERRADRRREAGGIGDRIYLDGRPTPANLPEGSGARLLFQRIRDEAHRFAITYHRKLRGRRSLSSVLDEIPGVGPARRRALLAHFGSVARLKEAAAGEIAGVQGISAAMAESISKYLSG